MSPVEEFSSNELAEESTIPEEELYLTATLQGVSF
jgi:hypothetical protein